MIGNAGNEKPNKAERLAFTPTDNEKLIEKAAAQRYPHRNVFLEGMAYMSEERSRIPLREAFVEGAKWQAEKAHTPTDDEREDMIAFLLRDHNFEESPWGRTYTDAEIANALRRSEVPEPSAEGPAFIALMPPSPETSKRWYSMYCRVCGIEEMMAGTADDPRLLARRDEHNRERHAEPQGEPSDARAKVIDALVMTRLSDFAGTDMGVIEQAADAVLAALRAAGGVR